MSKLYITCDHAAFDLKQKIVQGLNFLDIQIQDLVPVLDVDDDYPVTSKLLALQLKKDIDLGVESFGIAVCGSGQGICMAMNRFTFIRAAQPRTISESAKTREHNDSNVMCFGCDTVILDDVLNIIKTFVSTDFSKGLRHQRRIDQMSDKQYTEI
jgi:ribose 5-phosphate isomerase B